MTEPVQYTIEVSKAATQFAGAFTVLDVADKRPDLEKKRITIVLKNMANAGKLVITGRRLAATGGQPMNVYKWAPTQAGSDNYTGPLGITWEAGAQALAFWLSSWPVSPLPEGYAL